MLTRVAAAFGLVLLGSCSFIVDTCACSTVPAHAIVYGVVRDGIEPAAGATIGWRTWAQSCDGIPAVATGTVEGSASTTGPSGTYRAQVWHGPVGSSACVEVSAISGSRMGSARGVVTIRDNPRDSLRLDLVLR